MRKYGLMAAVAVLVLGAAGTAHAQGPGITTEVLLNSKVTPNNAGTRAVPKNVTLDLTVGTKNSDGSQPPVVSRALVSFDRGLVFNGGIFPSCSKATLDGGGKQACIRKGARVGFGSATAQVGTSKVPTTVTAFDGPGANKFELFVETSRPIRIAQALEGTLRNASGAYGKNLDVPIPEAIQQPVPGLFSSLTEFKTTLPSSVTRRSGGRRKSYVQFAQCTGGRLDFRYQVTKRRTTTPPSNGGTQFIAKQYTCRA